MLAEQMSEKEQKPPPCLDPEKCPRVAACLESSKLCHELGRVGSYRPCGIERRPLMTAVAVAAVLALLLNVYALFALSTDAKVIKVTAWAVGDTRAGFPSGTAYFGLTTAVAFDNNDKMYEKHWSRVDCHAHALPPNRPNTTKSHGDIDRCKSCKSDIGQIVTTVIVSAITTLGTLRYAHRRASPETDRNFFKAMGIIVGLIAFSTALGPMLAFRKHCTRSHTSALNMQDGWGPGQKSNAIDATSDRIHSTQARLHLHGLRGPPQGDVRRGAPRAPRTGEPRRGVRRAAARVDQYGLTFSRPYDDAGRLVLQARPFGPSGL